jgi:hypothetical protein
MFRIWVVALLAASLALLGCEADPTPAEQAAPDGQDQTDQEQEQEACDAAFAAAEDAGTEATEEDLHPAVAACPDIAAFTQAAEDHPEVLGDTEPQVWLAATCDGSEDPSVTGSALCAEVAGHGDDDPGAGQDEQDGEGDDA